jgi:hypothetical protein
MRKNQPANTKLPIPAQTGGQGLQRLSKRDIRRFNVVYLVLGNAYSRLKNREYAPLAQKKYIVPPYGEVPVPYRKQVSNIDNTIFLKYYLVMNKIILFALLAGSLANCCTKEKSQLIEQTQLTDLSLINADNTIPNEVKVLLSVYSPHITGFKNNYLVFQDGSSLLFNNGEKKPAEELLNNPDIQDMFAYSYIKGEAGVPAKFQDPGRIRNDDFFKKIYGKTSTEVQKYLVTIVWCPKLAGEKLQVTTINNVDKRLSAVSAELDEHPEWKDYLQSAGTFNWRVISGTSRLSAHSFGISIDLNTKYSNYWQWDYKSDSEDIELSYKNQFPQGIVDVFEKHGFIWGGKWYHYDTMHFEYRPELLFKK